MMANEGLAYIEEFQQARGGIVTVRNEIRPEEIVGAWLREKGAECQTLLVKNEELESEVSRLKEARAKQVATMQLLATALGLPYPDPKRILTAVNALVRPTT